MAKNTCIILIEISKRIEGKGCDKIERRENWDEIEIKILL